MVEVNRVVHGPDVGLVGFSFANCWSVEGVWGNEDQERERGLGKPAPSHNARILLITILFLHLLQCKNLQLKNSIRVIDPPPSVSSFMKEDS